MKKIIFILLLLPVFGFTQEIFFSKSNGEIIRASIDGLTQTVFYTAPSGRYVHAVTVDTINNKIYWNETFPNSSSKIMRSDLSTLSPELVLNISSSTIDKIEVARDTKSFSRVEITKKLVGIFKDL